MKKRDFCKKTLTVILTLCTLIAIFAITAFAEQTAAPPAEDANFFAKLYSWLGNYSSEILCALTFIGSVLVAFAYKRGLLPLISRAISNIGGAIGKIKDITEGFAEHSEKSIDEIKTKLGAAESALNDFASGIGSLEKELSEIKSESERYAKTEALVRAEVELLYDIFMSSSLPQYQKDAVARKVSEMRDKDVGSTRGEQNEKKPI